MLTNMNGFMAAEDGLMVAYDGRLDMYVDCPGVFQGFPPKPWNGWVLGMQGDAFIHSDFVAAAVFK